jgi:beta-phosphoglucomutase-like phosphatase (HAD superfamily)
MLIFDLDGTLIDSNGVWLEVDKIFLARRGAVYTQEYYEGVAHTILQNCASFTKEYLHLEESCEDIIAEWMDLAKDAYDHVELKPYAKEYLDRCRAAGHRMVMFTACVPQHCKAAVARHNLATYFEQIIYAQELGVDKRSPAIFRRVADMLGVSTKDCVLFDDSLAACKAAKAAGLTVVGIQDDYHRGSQTDMREFCDQYITGFQELL